MRAGLLLAAALGSVLASAQQGTWVPLTNLCPESAETALLLTDGSIFVRSFSNYQHHFKLTPTPDGNYVNGKWSQLADAPIGILYGPYEVLRDGRVFIAGGEYLSNGQNDHNTCEVYDPVTDSWTQGPDGLYGDIGDTGNSILSDGRVLVSTRAGSQTQIFDPVAMTWTASGTMSQDTGDEESWEILPDNSILNVFNIGQRWLPTTNQWIGTAAYPANNGLVDSAYEIGPAVMLYNGNVLALGGTNNTAIYTPPSTMNGAGSWVAGPKIPGGMTSPDCPAAVEPNGKVIFISTPTDFAAPTFNEYDPTSNTMVVINGPPNTDGVPSFTPRFLTLPNGQILLTGWGNQCWLYTPTGSPQNSWRAHLTSVKKNGLVFTLTGTQLNGLTEGGSYGDDASMNSNYPIVMLKHNASGKFFYAKSFNFSTMGLATGNTPVTCQFKLPAGAPAGSYTVTTSASGVRSSNSVQLADFIPPYAVQIYNHQGQSPSGGVAQLQAVDQQYYKLYSVPTSSGEVAAVQLTFQVPPGDSFSSIGCSLVVNGPVRTTNFIYLHNWKTGNYDLVGTAPMKGVDLTVSGSASDSTNYISPTGQVIAVDRVVFPQRLVGYLFQMKIDVASLTN